MKKYLFTAFVTVFLFSIFVTGCNKNKDREIYESTVKKELDSGIRNDTIFLSFTFGMRSDDFARRLKKLRKEGILYFNENKEYSYEMQLIEGINGIVEANLSDSYFVDRLYQLTLSVEPTKKNEDIIYPSYIHTLLTSLYAEKYGYDYFKIEGTFNEEIVFIDGNREIRIIEDAADVKVVYTELNMQRDKRIVEKTDLNKKVHKTKTDL